MKLRYMVLQLDLNARTETGRGTLKPINCDGYYLHKRDAQEVAELLSERFPGLTTHVVKIVE